MSNYFNLVYFELIRLINDIEQSKVVQIMKITFGIGLNFNGVHYLHSTLDAHIDLSFLIQIYQDFHKYKEFVFMVVYPPSLLRSLFLCGEYSSSVSFIETDIATPYKIRKSSIVETEKGTVFIDTKPLRTNPKVVIYWPMSWTKFKMVVNLTLIRFYLLP